MVDAGSWDAFLGAVGLHCCSSDRKGIAHRVREGSAEEDCRSDAGKAQQVTGTLVWKGQSPHTPAPRRFPVLSLIYLGR